MSKYERMQQELTDQGHTQAKAFGHSMKPILESGSLLTFEKRGHYEVGDIVFCKVKGRYIDAHKITKIDSQGRYLISNNHGHDNGWTSQIFGKVIQAVLPNGTGKTFR
jgi:SOS-response transcriptional repressor LexA